LLRLFSYFIANISLMKTLKNNNKWFTNEKNVPLVIKMLSKYNNCPKIWWIYFAFIIIILHLYFHAKKKTCKGLFMVG